MSEWYDSQKKRNRAFRQLLQEQIDKANQRRTLTSEEERRLSKLEAIAAKLTRGENVQNSQLLTWLSEDEYAQIEAEWQEQPDLRQELKDKPSNPKRYEEKLKQATSYYNRAEGYCSGSQNADSPLSGKLLLEGDCLDEETTFIFSGVQTGSCGDGARSRVFLS